MAIPGQRKQNIKRKRTRRPSEAKASFNGPNQSRKDPGCAAGIDALDVGTSAHWAR